MWGSRGLTFGGEPPLAHLAQKERGSEGKQAARSTRGGRRPTNTASYRRDGTAGKHPRVEGREATRGELWIDLPGAT